MILFLWTREEKVVLYTIINVFLELIWFDKLMIDSSVDAFLHF